MSSSAIRRRTLMNVHNDSITSSSTVQNDEEERQERRSSLVTPTVTYDQVEVKKHFELCHKMFLENKITPENSWDLRIIDYMLDLIKQQQSQKDSWQSAATALEICTKVYGCRVDYLHARGTKLARALAAQSSLEEEDTSEPKDGDAQQKKKKKTRPKLTLNSKRYICKDMNSMLGTVPQLPDVPFAVETDGDPEQTTNMFTFTVPFDQYYQEHLRDKKTPGFLSMTDVEKVNEAIIKVKPPKVKNFNICKEFENYDVNSIRISDNPSNSFASNVTQSFFDADGHPIVELDGPMPDIFAEQEIEDMIVEEEEIAQAAACFKTRQEVSIFSFSPPKLGQTAKTALDTLTENTISSDSSRWADTIWIGPSHWKNKLLRPSAPRYSGASEQIKVPRRQKQKEDDDKPINYYVEPPKIDFMKKTRKVKRFIDESKYLLPRNYLKRAPLDGNHMLFKYALGTKYQVDEENRGEFEHQYQDYNYNNLNDSQYCVATNNEDGPLDEVAGAEGDEIAPPAEIHPPISPGAVDNEIASAIQNDSPLGQTVQEEFINAQNAACGANFALDVTLIPDVALVPIQVPYAMHAKKVNMRRIKATMIDILKEGGVLSQNINNSPEEIKCVQFSCLYDRLKTDLPRSVSQEMSASISFFALLQLTNEKELTLCQADDMSNVTISNEIPVPPHLRV